MTKRASLQDQIAAAIPAGKVGLSLVAAAGIVGGPVPYARKAFEAVAAGGRAMLVRRGRGGALFLVRNGAGVLACKMCQREFTRGRKSKRVTCSTPCAMSYGWAKAGPDNAAKRGRTISASLNTPENKARQEAHNKRRWSKPGEREKLADQNRREWKKSEKAAIRAAKIRINHGSPEFRAKLSKIKKGHWEDPIIRQRMHDAAAASQKVQAYRSHFSELMKRRWKDGDLRAKYTAANRERNRIKSEKSKSKKRVTEEARP